MTGLAGIGRDVTEYKALETRLRQAQRLESIGRLAGGVAHDFNNLLTVIRGYSSLLLEHRKHTDSAYIGLVEIKRAAEKGAALTKQLLAFSRRKASEPQMIDLNAIIAEDERMLRRLIGDHIELNTNLDPALGLVRADPSDIHQSLLNLAVNARDAMPEGGSLTLATSNIDVDEEHAFRRAGVEPGQYVRLVVADTGVGMSADVRAHLFEPFFTTKDVDKGTGLGLSTVYGIIQQAGGHILVQTEAGEGASFEIILPRAQPPVATLAVAAESSPSIRGGTETLLLVEDQRELRTLLGSLLERLGYTVLQAGNGRMALRLMKRVTGPIHLLVTDLMMPGMLGSELAQRVTAAHPETKVLYVSGYGDVPAARPLPGGAASEFLQKSFTPEQLAAKVREMLDR
jgi:nitrogen-specific signal transduction histidine kinase